ncbi:unnamed protein product [Symbiodinium microadriaticum]|nr:unnamed protein product [Symbiodinium microadriaticum]
MEVLEEREEVGPVITVGPVSSLVDGVTTPVVMLSYTSWLSGRSGARCLEARRNVGRPAWQAVLRRLNRANLMPELDVDYNAGAAWLADNDMRANIAKHLKVSRQTAEDQAKNSEACALLVIELLLDYGAEAIFAAHAVADAREDTVTENNNSDII